MPRPLARRAFPALAVAAALIGLAIPAVADKITSLTALTTLANGDVVVVVDKSDTTMAATGTDKQVTIANFFGAPSNGNLVGWENGIPTPIALGTGLSISGSGPYTLNASGGTGSGTVTTVSVASANGLAGTVANATTTPALTLSTTITGILKGNGTAISAATAGTDYVSPSGNITGTAANVTGTVAVANGGTGQTSATAAFGALSPLTTKGDLLAYGTGNARLGVGSDGQVLTADSTQAAGLKWSAVGGTGTVTSVGLSLPSLFTVTGSPVTGAGTLTGTLAAQSANLVLAGPSSGSAAAPTFRALATGDLPTVLFSGDGFTAIANTTTATSVFGGGTVRRGSLTIPANTVQAGSRIILNLSGHFSNTSGNPTVALTLKIGSTTLAASTAGGSPNTATNAPWYTEDPIEIGVTAGGASGACYVRPSLVRLLQTTGTAAGGSTPMLAMSAPQTAVSVDWTQAQTIDFQWAWGAASTSNTATLDFAEVIIH